MHSTAADRSDEMENALHEKIEVLHEHLASLEVILAEYRQVRQSLLESEARFHLLIDHIKDYAIFMLDPEGYIASWNSGARQIKGYQADEIIGRHFSIFYSAIDQAQGKPTRGLATALREGRFLDEGWRVRKDGSQFWASVVITPIYDAAGTLLGYGKVTRDLTERKQMEDALRREFEAQEAVRMRDTFLTVAAHELKTPVTNLQGFAQVTLRHLERAEQLDPERVMRAFRVIDAQAGKLAQLVKQLLDFSRMQSGRSQLTRSTVDLADLTRQTIALAQVQTTEHTFVLDAPPDLSIEADALRLEQVLVNLLDNAIKYSPDGGEIRVAVRAPGPDQVQISVADPGIGIPEEERERIFEPFYRVHADQATADTSGVGLGLFVSGQIIALHGGQISVEAAPGGGSRFVITLPVHSRSTAQHIGEPGA